jgi:putative FmdB family regulatory protein
MPIFEMRCDDCGHEYEVFVRREGRSTDCASCGSGNARRRVSRTSFVLKGTGWYASEYGVGASSKSEEGAGAPAEQAACANEAAGGQCACRHDVN